jgi:hypothetical protein
MYTSHSGHRSFSEAQATSQVGTSQEPSSSLRQAFAAAGSTAAAGAACCATAAAAALLLALDELSGGHCGCEATSLLQRCLCCLALQDARQHRVSVASLTPS